MAAIQQKLKEEGISLDEIKNMDETPGVMGLNPTYSYAPKNSGGVTKMDNDERQRITINVCISADGSSLPVSFIIKCTTAKEDQSDIRVIESLLKKPEFEDDGWSLHWWERTMEIKEKAKRPYLKNVDGRVIWAQVKAYQDTPGLAMWCDLVMGPARVASGSRKWALIWDNCAAHLVPSVIAVFAEWNILTFTFPANMTDILQPVDIVANGPLKAHTKNARAKQLYDYFQVFSQNYADAVSDGVKPPDYRPPAPTVPSFISLVSNIFSEQFRAKDYMEGVRRCFVSVGLAPKNGMGAYVSYQSHSRGIKSVKEFRGRRVTVGDFDELSAVELLADIKYELRVDRGVDWGIVHTYDEATGTGTV